MNVFVSGATGFIGSRLCLKLAEDGYIVHALYRSPDKTKVISHPEIRLFRGDILDKDSLDKAISGCQAVYHAAAFASVWEKNPGMIYRLNIEGTMNVIRSSLQSGVEKIVVTSTAGILGASGTHEINEQTYQESFFTDYENSKFILEKIIGVLSGTGLDIIIVNPTRVYGPGLLSESNGVTRMIDRYCRGKWHFIPGNGNSVGNYVFVDDVVNGHIQAMAKGKTGEHYILGGENASYTMFFDNLSKVSGKKYRLFKLPLFMMLPVAYLLLFIAVLTHRRPLITPALVRKFNADFRVSSEKAEKTLGYDPRKLSDGLEKTIEWLKHREK